MPELSAFSGQRAGHLIGICNEEHRFLDCGNLEGMRLIDAILGPLDRQTFVHLNHPPRLRILQGRDENPFKILPTYEKRRSPPSLHPS